MFLENKIKKGVKRKSGYSHSHNMVMRGRGGGVSVGLGEAVKCGMGQFNANNSLVHFFFYWYTSPSQSFLEGYFYSLFLLVHFSFSIFS